MSCTLRGAAPPRLPLLCSYDGYDLSGSPVMAGSAPECCAICGRTPGCNFYSFCTPGGGCTENCYLKTSNKGRMARPDRISGPIAPPPAPTCSITLEACPSLYAEPGFDSLDDAGTYYTYNVLAELDQEGEWTEGGG